MHHKKTVNSETRSLHYFIRTLKALNSRKLFNIAIATSQYNIMNSNNIDITNFYLKKSYRKTRNN